MPDRTINFGESEAEATYQIQDTDGAAGGGNFVVAKDTNANTVLLEYDPGTDTWEYAGDVDLNGGTLTAGSVNTDDETINNLQTIGDGANGLQNENDGRAKIETSHTEGLAAGASTQAFDAADPDAGFIVASVQINGDVATYLWDGTDATLSEQSDPQGSWGATQGGSVFNLYYDSNDSTLKIENNSGNPKDFNLRLIS